MDYFQAIFLGILQGITEFLPISSSGHLVIAQKLFGIKEAPIFFDILVHLGTLLTVVFYFRKRIIELVRGVLRGEKDSLSYFKVLVVGTFPIVIFGFFIRDYIGFIFNSLMLVGFAYLGTSAILFATLLFNKSGASGLSKRNQPPSFIDAIFIGVFQAVAILPGISRSGSTISAGIFRKLDRETAFQFSFFLAIPAILGAFFLEVMDLGLSGILTEIQDPIIGLIGMIMSIIFGFLSLGLLEKILLRGKFYFFGIYCFFLGLIILILIF